MSNIIEDHAGWLVDRAKVLASTYGADFDDCYQQLALYLLQFESQKSAWFSASRDIRREAGLIDVSGDDDKEPSPVLRAAPLSACRETVCPGSFEGMVGVDMQDAINARLSSPEAEVFGLRLQGFSLMEIAERVGCSFGHSFNLNKSAAEKLKEDFAND